jgi:hypothetical protein
MNAPDPNTMTITVPMFVVTDGATYRDYFSPYTDTVSIRCSARIGTFTYYDMCTTLCGAK